MSRVIRSWISMFSCVGLISVMGAEENRLSGTKAAKEAGDEDATMALLSVFAQALHSIRQEFVQEDKATIERLVRGAIAGMASGLDGFSGYLDAESVRALNDAEMNRGAVLESLWMSGVAGSWLRRRLRGGQRRWLG